MDNLTIIKLLRIQNESLLSLLYIVSNLPELDSVQYSEIKRIGDDLRKGKEELDSIIEIEV